VGGKGGRFLELMW